jgi:hypothetical protein
MAVVKKEVGKGVTVKRRGKSADKAESESGGEYRLPTETSEPVESLQECLTLIYGFRKIGKTSMLSQAPKTLVLATEVGYKGLSLVKEDIGSWVRAQQVLRALRKDKTFKTVVLDTVDLFYRLVEKETYRELGIEDLSEAEWGKGWNHCKKMLSDYLNELTRVGKGVFLISHANEQSIRQRQGGEFDRVMPTMAKQAREVVEPMIDIWACYRYDGDRRILTVVGDEHLSAGHRFENRFRTPDGRRLKNIDMGTSAGEAWKNFNDAFNNRFTPSQEEDLVEEDRRRPKKTDGGTKKKFSIKR